MKIKAAKKIITDEEYYEKRGVLGEIVDGEVALSLDDALKLDPLYLVSIKKVATKKGIPYQTLVRQWVAEKIRKELKIA